MAGVNYFLNWSRTGVSNNSEGFSSDGFQRLVKEWLKEIFPSHGSGGVVCIIDNLELLETASKARKVLEGLRDTLFNVEGLRWVFCGANGIVSSMVASPRLSGYLSRPVVELSAVRGDKLPELIQRRMEEFSIEFPKYGYLRLTAQELQKLYWILNLRDLLAHADDYCMYIAERTNPPQSDVEKAKRFENWLQKETVDQYDALSKRISRSAWELLDTAMSEDLKGTFGPGDFNFFKKHSFSTIEYKTFTQHMRKFEDLGIVARTMQENEDDEKKRIIYSVTSKGALIHYARTLRSETHTMATPWLRRAHSH